MELIKTIPNEYDIVLNVVIAGDLASLLSTRERYEKEILKSENAKLSNIESHNKCYTLLPGFISECISYIFSFIISDAYNCVNISNSYK